MNNFIKEDDKQTVLIVNYEGTKRYRVKPQLVEEVEAILARGIEPSLYPPLNKFVGDLNPTL